MESTLIIYGLAKQRYNNVDNTLPKNSKGIGYSSASTVNFETPHHSVTLQL